MKNKMLPTIDRVNHKDSRNKKIGRGANTAAKLVYIDDKKYVYKCTGINNFTMNGIANKMLFSMKFKSFTKTEQKYFTHIYEIKYLDGKTYYESLEDYAGKLIIMEEMEYA